MRLSHICVAARNADRLSDFYTSVFGCKVMRAPKTLSGEKVSKGNGLPNSEIYSIWLAFPGLDTPFLELHEYKSSKDCAAPCVDELGYRHLSFTTNDIHATTQAVLKAGGSFQGEITNFGTEDCPVQIVYMRDCEGNILEIEQSSG